MDLNVIGSGGETLAVSDQAFGRDFNEALVHQAVTAFLSGARHGTKAHKSRSDVRGGGAKPWRQKGTGRARAGTSRSPLWRGGGVAFAARPRNFDQKLNKKMYRAAMRSILSELARQGRLVVAPSITVETPKTRDLVARLAAWGLQSVLIVTDQADQNLNLAARNLVNVDVCEVGRLDPVRLMRFDSILATEAAIRQIEGWLS